MTGPIRAGLRRVRARADPGRARGRTVRARRCRGGDDARVDGTLRSFAPVWIVPVDGNLYVRSYGGTGGAWYRHAARHPAGAIRARGHQADVVFSPADDNVRDAIDADYRAKYARYGDGYLQPMLAGPAAESTLRVDPTN